MGRASRKKRERREFEKKRLYKNLPTEMRGTRIRFNREKPKLSAAIIKLIRPFIDDHLDIEDYRTLVAVGVVSWNIAILSEGSQEKALTLIKDIGLPDRNQVEWMVSKLVHRKLSMFGNDDRYIGTWDVSRQSGNKFRVVVAAVNPE